MEVGAWTENLTRERCTEVGVARRSRDELFRGSDFVSCTSDSATGLPG